MKARIVEAVRSNPGIHFRELKREVDCSSTTLDYHLERSRLEDEHIRGYRRIFPPDIQESLHDPLAALNHDTRGDIVRVVDEKDRNLSSIADVIAKSVSTVSHHLDILKDDGVLAVSRDGRSTVYSTTGITRQALDRYDSILEQASDRFIAMWE
jgi:predicted transcriptional regulator